MARVRALAIDPCALDVVDSRGERVEPWLMADGRGDVAKILSREPRPEADPEIGDGDVRGRVVVGPEYLDLGQCGCVDMMGCVPVTAYVPFALLGADTAVTRAKRELEFRRRGRVVTGHGTSVKG